MATGTVDRNELREPGFQAGVRPTSIGKTARRAGLLYVAIFVLYPLAALVGRSSLVVSGDAAGTAANLVADEALFGWGMVGLSVVICIEVVLAALLYAIFRPVSRSISLAAAFARLGEGVVMAINLFTGFLALLAAGGAGYLAAFSREQLDALTMLALDLDEFVVLLWGVFFALHLLLLGYLVYRSGFFPRILGVMLALAGIGYFAQSLGFMVVPDSSGLLDTIVFALAVPGELAFALWLVIKRIDEDKWRTRALEAEASPV
jgi:hypothetical protein